MIEYTISIDMKKYSGSHHFLSESRDLFSELTELARIYHTAFFREEDFVQPQTTDESHCLSTVLGRHHPHNNVIIKLFRHEFQSEGPINKSNWFVSDEMCVYENQRVEVKTFSDDPIHGIIIWLDSEGYAYVSHEVDKNREIIVQTINHYSDEEDEERVEFTFAKV